MNRLLLVVAFSTVAFVPAAAQWHWQHPLPQGNTLFGAARLSATAQVAVGGCGTILRTTNAGSSWQFSSVGDSVYLADVAFADSLNGLAVGFSSRGLIYRTWDGGERWSEQVVTNGVIIQGVAFASPNIAVAVGYQGALLRSTDGGSSWETRQTNTSKTLNGVSFCTPTDGFAVGSSGAMIRTTDGGLTWSVVTIPTTESLYAVGFGSPSTGFAVGGFSPGIVLRTTDAGTSWTAIPHTAISGMLNSVSWFDSLVCVVTSKQGMAIRTTDTGARWDSLKTLSDANSIAVLAGGAAIAVGWNGMIARSTDAGGSWSPSLTSQGSYEFSSVCFADSLSGWAAGGVVFRTKDGGSSWSHYEGDSLQGNHVYFFDKNTGWITGRGDSAIRKTTDGGATWFTQRLTGIASLARLSFVNEQVGWGIGSSNTIMHTTDGGTTWSSQSSGVSSNLLSVCFTDQENGWVVGGSGTVLRTSNGGDVWQPVAVSTSASLHRVAFVSPGRGVIVGDDCTILNTTNGGVNWQVRTLGPKGHYLRAISFQDSSIVWASGESGWIMRSADGGVSWARASSVTNQNLYAIHAEPGGGVWAVGSRGTIVSTRAPKPITVGVGDERRAASPVPFLAILSQNYPNPFNPSTTIRYGLPSRVHVLLTVFNTLGQQVSILQNGEQDAGYHEVRFDARSLPSGVYFYRMQAGSYTETKKLLLIR